MNADQKIDLTYLLILMVVIALTTAIINFADPLVVALTLSGGVVASLVWWGRTLYLSTYMSLDL